MVESLSDSMTNFSSHGTGRGNPTPVQVRRPGRGPGSGLGSLRKVEEEVMNKDEDSTMMAERQKKKQRLEDALSATRAAVEEGIVPGGGTVLIRSANDLEKLKVNTEFKTGVNILKKALEEPIRVIADNSGAEGAVVLSGVLEGTGNHGYDAASDTFGDMLKLGIIDPAKVTRAAVENAISVGGMILTTESMMTDIQEPAAPAAPPMPGGMDGMGMM